MIEDFPQCVLASFDDPYYQAAYGGPYCIDGYFDGPAEGGPAPRVVGWPQYSYCGAAQAYPTVICRVTFEGADRWVVRRLVETMGFFAESGNADLGEAGRYVRYDSPGNPTADDGAVRGGCGSSSLSRSSSSSTSSTSESSLSSSSTMSMSSSSSSSSASSPSSPSSLGFVGIVPTMTSNTTPSPYVASASPYNPAVYGEPYTAFEPSFLYWRGLLGHSVTIYLGSTGKTANHYYIRRYNYDAKFNGWTISGSNDGSAWTAIHSVTGHVGGPYGWGEGYWTHIGNTTSYRYYRLTIDQLSGGASLGDILAWQLSE